MNSELYIIIFLGAILISSWIGLGIYSYFKKRQKENFLFLLKKGKEPIPVVSNEHKRLISRWIHKKQINGYYSEKRDLYIPINYLKNQIDQILKQRGLIDLVELIDQYQIPDEFIGALARGYLSKDTGFWDLIERKYVTYSEALRQLVKTLTNVCIIQIRELLFQLGGWKEEDLLKLLGQLTDQGRFRGFIDTQNNLYIVFIESSTTTEDIGYDEDVMVHFFKESLKIEDVIQFETVLKLFKIELNQFKKLIEKFKTQSDLDLIFTSENGVISLLDIYEQLIFDVSTISELDIGNWAEKWRIDSQEVESRLKQLDGTLLCGEFTENRYKGELYSAQLKSELNFKTIQNRLEMSAANVAQLLSQLYINKGLIGVYQNGKIQGMAVTKEGYVKNDLDSNFIFNHCPFCNITFIVSKTIRDLDYCLFCNNIRLEAESSRIYKRFVDPRLKGVVRDLKAFQDSGIVIKLDSILQDIDLPQKKALYALKDLIFREVVKGKIDMSRQVFLTRVERIASKSRCYMCDETLKASNIEFKCNYCGIQSCTTCFRQIREIKIEVCPLCGEVLEKKNYNL